MTYWYYIAEIIDDDKIFNYEGIVDCKHNLFPLKEVEEHIIGKFKNPHCQVVFETVFQIKKEAFDYRAEKFKNNG